MGPYIIKHLLRNDELPSPNEALTQWILLAIFALNRDEIRSVSIKNILECLSSRSCASASIDAHHIDVEQAITHLIERDIVSRCGKNKRNICLTTTGISLMKEMHSSNAELDECAYREWSDFYLKELNLNVDNLKRPSEELATYWNNILKSIGRWYQFYLEHPAPRHHAELKQQLHAALLSHSDNIDPIELIGLYSFAKLATTNGTCVESLVQGLASNIILGLRTSLPATFLDNVKQYVSHIMIYIDTNLIFVAVGLDKDREYSLSIADLLVKLSKLGFTFICTDITLAEYNHVIDEVVKNINNGITTNEATGIISVYKMRSSGTSAEAFFSSYTDPIRLLRERGVNIVFKSILPNSYTEIGIPDYISEHPRASDILNNLSDAGKSNLALVHDIILTTHVVEHNNNISTNIYFYSECRALLCTLDNSILSIPNRALLSPTELWLVYGLLYPRISDITHLAADLVNMEFVMPILDNAQRLITAYRAHVESIKHSNTPISINGLIAETSRMAFSRPPLKTGGHLPAAENVIDASNIEKLVSFTGRINDSRIKALTDSLERQERIHEQIEKLSERRGKINSLLDATNRSIRRISDDMRIVKSELENVDSVGYRHSILLLIQHKKHIIVLLCFLSLLPVFVLLHLFLYYLWKPESSDNLIAFYSFLIKYRLPWLLAISALVFSPILGCIKHSHKRALQNVKHDLNSSLDTLKNRLDTLERRRHRLTDILNSCDERISSLRNSKLT